MPIFKVVRLGFLESTKKQDVKTWNWDQRLCGTQRAMADVGNPCHSARILLRIPFAHIRIDHPNRSTPTGIFKEVSSRPRTRVTVGHPMFDHQRRRLSFRAVPDLYRLRRLYKRCSKWNNSKSNSTSSSSCSGKVSFTSTWILYLGNSHFF